MLERLRDVLTRGSRVEPLTGLVAVVPGDDSTARQVIDGHSLPVVTATQWAHLPSGWLQRAAAAA